jgi:hypothetical protein
MFGIPDKKVTRPIGMQIARHSAPLDKAIKTALYEPVSNNHAERLFYARSIVTSAMVSLWKPLLSYHNDYIDEEDEKSPYVDYDMERSSNSVTSKAEIDALIAESHQFLNDIEERHGDAFSDKNDEDEEN